MRIEDFNKRIYHRYIIMIQFNLLMSYLVHVPNGRGLVCGKRLGAKENSAIMTWIRKANASPVGSIINMYMDANTWIYFVYAYIFEFCACVRVCIPV